MAALVTFSFLPLNVVISSLKRPRMRKNMRNLVKSPNVDSAVFGPYILDFVYSCVYYTMTMC